MWLEGEGGSYQIELLEFSCPQVVLFVFSENQLLVGELKPFMHGCNLQ